VKFHGLLYDRAASRANSYSFTEKVIGTYSASVQDGRKGLGGATAPTGIITYALRWDGVLAENTTEAELKAFFVACGHSIAWS
jgi:hypothetical protein